MGLGEARNQEDSAKVWVGRAVYWNLFHMEINNHHTFSLPTTTVKPMIYFLIFTFIYLVLLGLSFGSGISDRRYDLCDL